MEDCIEVLQTSLLHPNILDMIISDLDLKTLPPWKNLQSHWGSEIYEVFKAGDMVLWIMVQGQECGTLFSPEKLTGQEDLAVTWTKEKEDF